MSLSSLAPLFGRISSFAKYCPTQILNKPNFNLSINLNITRFHSQLARPIEVDVVDTKAEKAVTQDVLKKINEVQQTSPSRLFAVVQVCGKQFKVTTGDVIILEGYWPPDVGDEISLDKVLCAGGSSFSLIGTPLVQPGLVNIHATVIEKALSHTKTHFRKKRRKQYKRINFYRCERTVLRINDVGIGQLKDSIDEY